MRITKALKTIAGAIGLTLIAWSPVPGQAQQPDNTTVNKGDANTGAVTADHQKTNATDQDLTARIRKAVMADKGLSTYAHNVKIVSQNGIVTLKGPVRSADEEKSIMAKAVDAAGGRDKVVDQMTVKP